jgi:hypothetical protein
MTSALSNCTATPCTRGRREELIELFETELLHTQEAVGSRVLAQFRDLDHPDTFTWMRGFRDMDHRRRALMAFYGGPVWAQHRDAANATMIDSDNVLLLTPEGPLHRMLPGRDHPVRIVVSHGDTTSVVPGVAIAADS